MLRDKVLYSIEIPFYEGQIPAGFPSPGADYAEKRINLNDTFIKHPKSSRLVEMPDDSMIYAYIPPGAKLLVDESLKATSGDIVAAIHDGEFTIRFYEKMDSTGRLIPANKKFQSIEMSFETNILILGVVINVFIDLGNRKSSLSFQAGKQKKMSVKDSDTMVDLDKIFNIRPLSTFMVATIGSSMNGAFIPDKSKLLIDKSLEPKTGDIVVAACNDGFTVKYFEMQGIKCRLLPANDNFKVIEVTEAMQLQIWGVVNLIIIDPKDINYVRTR